MSRRRRLRLAVNHPFTAAWMGIWTTALIVSLTWKVLL